MKKRRLTLMLMMGITGLFLFDSCKDDEEDPAPEPTVQEFVADDASFSSWMSWTLAATHSGMDPALGAAHGGNDSTVTRNVYMSGTAKTDGQYDVGTIVVKHSTNPAGTLNEHTAMVKRGGSFDAPGNNWEYFMLDSTGSKIAVDGSGMVMRGSNLMGGMCQGCHSQAKSDDFVFTK